VSKHEQQPAAEPTPTSPADAPGASEPIVAEESADDVAEAPGQPAAASGEPVAAAKIAELEELAAERTHDLQRLQAEYANYKKRVDRDRALARQGGVEAVVLDLLPVLDSIEAAREHDELTGGFKLVAEELERLTAKYGLTVYGEVGDEFDPNIHEALMQVPMEGVEVTTVSALMQKGVRLNERVLRPARVGVAEPE
jgi:molecular chaperone GrpE